MKAIRGAEAGSDHYLLLCKIRLKLRRAQQRKAENIFDSQRLKDTAVKESFAIELSNRFHLLCDLPVQDLEEHSQHVQDIFIETSRTTLGYRSRKRKQWIREETWETIEKRRMIKQKLLACAETEKETLQQQYREAHHMVKKRTRADKRAFLDNLAEEAQTAADSGDTRSLYKITKQLSGKVTSTSNIVKDKNGKTLTNEQDQRSRWAQHFKEVLNREEPEEAATVEETCRRLEVKQGRISCKEIEDAICLGKNNRAPGEDRITADMLKVDPELSARCLVDLFNLVWEEEEVPAAWKKGIIVKLPKKGDLSNCSNWRGINLLSVPGKVFCRVLLQRVKNSVDKILREEQAGFRSGRSCTDQIFVLRTIVEQSLEWNSALYINFIDFEKAFDSIHHPSLWKILGSYGFPLKIINILKNMYADNQCCVRHEGQESEWFQVKSGVRQGCIISPLLFLVAIDWVMKKTMEDRPRGLVWELSERLEDEDFADDLALLAHTQSDIQEKTNRVDRIARSIGLRINHSKSKIMKLNAKANRETTIGGATLEEVKDFKYLGSYISYNGGIDKEISTRIGQAATAFRKLDNIWRSTQYKQETKLRLYQSNVRSVLLYASETWKTNKKIESKLRGFEGRCLRRILRIRWEHRTTNEEISKRTGITNIVLEVKKRRWKWLGHVLRMNKERHPRKILRWTPPGKRSRGRPTGTWRRTVEQEMNESGKTWIELTWLAQDRGAWRKFVDALCSTGS